MRTLGTLVHLLPAITLTGLTVLAALFIVWPRNDWHFDDSVDGILNDDRIFEELDVATWNLAEWKEYDHGENASIYRRMTNAFKEDTLLVLPVKKDVPCSPDACAAKTALRHRCRLPRS